MTDEPWIHYVGGPLDGTLGPDPMVSFFSVLGTVYAWTGERFEVYAGRECRSCAAFVQVRPNVPCPLCGAEPPEERRR